jgi:hypothetical protein
MMVPSQETDVCAFCKGPIVPFGRLRQRFVLAEFGPLCLACAAEHLPQDVADAKVIEAAAATREKEPH